MSTLSSGAVLLLLLLLPGFIQQLLLLMLPGGSRDTVSWSPWAGRPGELSPVATGGGGFGDVGIVQV